MIKTDCKKERQILNRSFSVYRDNTGYTSNLLKDFIYESNKGSNFFFVQTKEEAIQELTETQ